LIAVEWADSLTDTGTIEMLCTAKITAFLATTNPARCKKFYESVLGLRLVSDDDFALAFDSGGTQLRIQKVEKLDPHPFTSLGWQVPDIRNAVTKLAQAGVEFETYPYLQQNELKIWRAPSGTKVAWFKDPDGNLLSISESESD
jgi:catechol 2,3-dioxygenase-like lactoylglutathione lyase family enzyme